MPPTLAAGGTWEGVTPVGKGTVGHVGAVWKGETGATHPAELQIGDCGAKQSEHADGWPRELWGQPRPNFHING